MSQFEAYLEKVKNKKKENWDNNGDGDVSKEEVVDNIKKKAKKKKDKKDEEE